MSDAAQNMNYSSTTSSAEDPKELTATALILGAILAVIMAAANIYLALKAGMTVCASIPAAVISMGVLTMMSKFFNRKGTIQENNIVQTVASCGEAIGSGIVFTIPALVIAGIWTEFDYWTVTAVYISGGLMGIVFMIPIRRVLISDPKSELPYPEGVACAEVLKTGEEGGKGLLLVFGALLIGGVFKFFINGIRLIKGSVEMAFGAGSTGFYFGTDISPALMAVGFIIGLDIAVLIFIGGAISWIVGIPILLATTGVGSGELLDQMWTLWSTKIRYLGVGAMAIGGIWSIISIWPGVKRGMKETLAGIKNKGAGQVARVDRDMSLKTIGIILAVAVVGTLLLYTSLTHRLGVASITTLIMIISAFFFVAVSSYIVGLVGSSSNPISGMTICTLLFAALIMSLFGISGETAILATLGVAGVVCCAAATGGDLSQDLKTGYLVKATPRSQQWAKLVGTLVPAFFIAPILGLLHAAYGIGTGGPESLQAPQASLFASIAQALFQGTGSLPKDMIAIGAFIGIALIVSNELLKKSKYSLRTHVMPVAVGIYLPLTLSTPILLGGLIAYFAKRKLRNESSEVKTSATQKGILMSSGLIAGEAIVGIAMAIPIVMGAKFPVHVWGEGDFVQQIFKVVTVLVFAALAFGLYKLVSSKKA